LYVYDDRYSFGRDRMGKKSRGRAHVRGALPVQETNVEDGVRKPLSRQKRSEVNSLVERLLKGKIFLMYTLQNSQKRSYEHQTF
jgi:hypothetical protein